MTDYLNRFGTVTNQGSTNTLDFEAIDPRAAMQTHRTGEKHESTVVFHIASDFTGTVTPKLIHCDTPDGTFTDLTVGETVVDPKSGIFALLEMPKSHKRYMRAILTAAASGATIEAFMEPGPGLTRY